MPGVCPRRKIPDFLGPDLHPARPSDDVFPSAWPSWLSFTPAPRVQRRSRGMSTDVQGRLQENLQENSGTTPRAPHHGGMAVLAVVHASPPRSTAIAGHVHRRSRETPGKPPRKLRHHTSGACPPTFKGDSRKTSKKTQAPHQLTRPPASGQEKAMPGVCPRRKIPDFLGPDLHPARPSDDVFPSAWPSWLSFTPAPPFNGDRGACPPTFKGDSRKTSKKTQAPHHSDRGACPPTFKGDSRKTSKKTQAPHHGKPPRRLRHHTTGTTPQLGSRTVTIGILRASKPGSRVQVIR
jgi:hypothetical protein